MGSKSNQFLYGDIVDGERVPGAWDIVSANFAEATRGDVVTLVGGADPNRVFAQTELPRLLNNRHVDTIDGIPRTHLAGLTTEQAFEAIRAQSEVRSSELRIAVDDAGLPLDHGGRYRFDTREFFEGIPGAQGQALEDGLPTRAMGDFVPPGRLQGHAQGLEELQRIHHNLEVAADGHGKTARIIQGLGLLDHLGHAIDVLSLAVAAREAKAAFDRGDQRTAQAILTDWFLEYGGAVLAGRLAALATAPLLAAGPLGALLAAGLTIGASAVGAAYADDIARWLQNILAGWFDDLLDPFQEEFRLAELNFSPIVLDLDGDGVLTLDGDSPYVHFDHDGNGFAERSGWVSPGDALLVRDLNGNGAIDDGGELFGNWTLLADGSLAADGFRALKELDDNDDDVLDSLDAAWATLRLWRDGNSNGRLDDDELLTLQRAGVTRMNLVPERSSEIDAHGNELRLVSSWERKSGHAEALVDVWFDVDLTRTVQLDPLPVPAAIEALPNLPGASTLPDLHQVMTTDASGGLEQRVRRWMGTSAEERAALMPDILLHWTGTQAFSDPDSSMDPAARRRLAALERLVGHPFREGWENTDPPIPAAERLERTFQWLCEEFEQQLIAQVDARPLLQVAAVAPPGTDPADAGGLPTSVVAALVDLVRQQQGPATDLPRLLKLHGVLERLGAPGPQVAAALHQRGGQEPGLLGAQLEALGSVVSVIAGGEQDDLLQGSAESEWIEGRGGQDNLLGYSGTDFLVGGSGDDLLQGHRGDDVYVLSRGDGVDRISDVDTAANLDTIWFTDLAFAGLGSLSRVRNDLRLEYGSGDSVTVLDHFFSDDHRIEQFRFADGLILDDTGIAAALEPV